MVNWKNTPKTQSFFKNSTVIFCYVKGKKDVLGVEALYYLYSSQKFQGGYFTIVLYHCFM
jgi:hypothetical protein